MVIKKGELFILTSGEYSDYDLMAVCRADEDIDIEALGDEYLQSRPEERKRYHFGQYRFAKWLLVDKRVITEVPYKEWHTGSYSMDFTLLDSADDDRFWLRD